MTAAVHAAPPAVDDMIDARHYPLANSPARAAIVERGRAQLRATGFAALPGLTSLNLDDCPGVTDASMDTVGKLANLEFLHIGATKVTDAGLAKGGL